MKIGVRVNRGPGPGAREEERASRKDAEAHVPAECRERGVALLTAMLVVALVAIVGASMLTRQNLAVHRSGNLWLEEQAQWYAAGVEAWAGTILRRDLEGGDIDHLGEVWAQPDNILPIEGGNIAGRIIDLQGRFNLNSLAGTDAQAALRQFERLLELAGADPVTARQVAQSTRDWIDADIEPTRPEGAEDNYYLGLDPAYRTGNRPLADASELRAVRGMDSSLFAALAPHIVALPDPTRVNVNTATAPVLASLADDVDLATAESLVERRGKAPWQSVEAFLQEPALAGREVPADRVAVSSSYFMAAGTVTVDRIRAPFRSVIARTADGATRVVTHSRSRE